MEEALAAAGALPGVSAHKGSTKEVQEMQEACAERLQPLYDDLDADLDALPSSLGAGLRCKSSSKLSWAQCDFLSLVSFFSPNNQNDPGSVCATRSSWSWG
jgi:hypothetical protein